MVESETEKLRGDRVGLDLVQGRQGIDKEIEVDFGVIHFTPKSSTTRTKLIGRVR